MDSIFHTSSLKPLTELYPLSEALLADATVFGMPSKEIYQCCKRLPYQTEADPEEAVTQDLAARTFHLFQGLREKNHRGLDDHANKSDAYGQLAFVEFQA